MSAWIPSKPHFRYLVTAAVEAGSKFPWKGTPENLGQLLLDECVKSVSYRYSSQECLPGPIQSLLPEEERGYKYGGHTPSPIPLSNEEIQQAISCLEYQSCEHPGWESSKAHEMLIALMRCYPGKPTGAWGLDETHEKELQDKED